MPITQEEYADIRPDQREELARTVHKKIMDRDRAEILSVAETALKAGVPIQDLCVVIMGRYEAFTPDEDRGRFVGNLLIDAATKKAVIDRCEKVRWDPTSEVAAHKFPKSDDESAPVVPQPAKGEALYLHIAQMLRDSDWSDSFPVAVFAFGAASIFEVGVSPSVPAGPPQVDASANGA